MWPKYLQKFISVSGKYFFFIFLTQIHVETTESIRIKFFHWNKFKVKITSGNQITWELQNARKGNDKVSPLFNLFDEKIRFLCLLELLQLKSIIIGIYLYWECFFVTICVIRTMDCCPRCKLNGLICGTNGSDFDINNSQYFTIKAIEKVDEMNVIKFPNTTTMNAACEAQNFPFEKYRQQNEWKRKRRWNQ